MEELREHLVEALEHCIDIGMKLPFIVCAVSPNGSVLAIRYNEGRGPDPLAQHFENEAFTTPVNIMVVDRDGKAARAVIEGGNVNYQ